MSGHHINKNPITRKTEVLGYIDTEEQKANIGMSVPANIGFWGHWVLGNIRET